MLSRNPVPDRWCGHLAQIVEQWRGRIGDDDLLVATIRVPSATPPLPPTRSLAEDIEQETTYAPQVPAGSDAAYGVDTAAKAGARA
jgi:hypothetical protein